MIWKISALLTRNETLWKLDGEVGLKIFHYHGWMLVHLTKICYPTIACYQDPRCSYKHTHMSTIECIAENIDYVSTNKDIVTFSLMLKRRYV